MEVTTTTRRWGNSLGVIIPNEVVVNEKIQEGQPIVIDISTKKKTTGADIFGILKGKLGNIDQLMEDVDKELWGIEK